MEATAPVLRKAPGFRFRTYPALPVDAVFLVGLVMPAIVVDVQIQARFEIAGDARGGPVGALARKGERVRDFCRRRTVLY